MGIAEAILGNSTFANLFTSMSNNYTGSGELTIFFLMIFVVAVLIGFAVDIDLIIIFSTPITVLGYIMYPGSIMGAVAGLQLLILVFLMAKRFILNS